MREEALDDFEMPTFDEIEKLENYIRKSKIKASNKKQIEIKDRIIELLDYLAEIRC